MKIMKSLMKNIMPLNYQIEHASGEKFFSHKTAESFGDSGNIKNAQDTKDIANNF